MLFGALIADEPVGDRRIVEEAVAEIGILRAGSGHDAEHVGVERPRAEALRERGPEEQVGRARAGLEFRFEQFAERIAAIGRAGRQFYAEQKRGLRAARPVVEEAVLAKQRDVAEPGGVAAMIDRV